MTGNVFGPLVPVTEMPGLPFTFKNSDAVFVALDGALENVYGAKAWSLFEASVGKLV